MTWPKVIKLIWNRASNFRHINLRNYAMNVWKNSFIMSWMTDLRNGYESSSVLKTYSWYKMNFGTECYLKHISKPKFGIDLSKLRASSHDLEVERGRYVRLKLDINEQLCISCHVIEDEEHFVTDCENNRGMRTFWKHYRLNSFFFLMNPHLCSTRLQNRNLYLIFLGEVGSDHSGGILSPVMGTCFILATWGRHFVYS